MEPNSTIAVSGSPNTITEISVDIQEDYLSTPLLGTMVSLNVLVKDRDEQQQNILVLGQLTDLETQNRWHENPALKNYIKKRGQLPNLTSVGDITTAKVQVLGAYHKTDAGYKKQRLSVPIGSGIPMEVVNRETIISLMEKEMNYGFIGRAYGGRGDVPAPVYTRHFGDYDAGGSGEAYMGGVFGPTGSGKSVIAATLDVLWTRNHQMGVLILDPQSEFAGNGFSKGQKFQFDFHGMLQAATADAPEEVQQFRPNRDVIAIDRIQLDGTTLFVALLRKRGFFSDLGLGDGKHRQAEGNLVDRLTVLYTQGWRPAKSLDELEFQNPTVYEDLRQTILDACVDAYAAASAKNKRKEFEARWADSKTSIHATWKKVSDLFAPDDANGNRKQDLTKLVADVMLYGRKVILDLDPELLELDDEFKLDIMAFVFKRISQAAHQQYKRMDLANCLIVLDEAGLFIPERTDKDEKRAMADDIASKVKMLRKYRVGFQFIAQNTSDIRKDIYKNLHYRIYGAGLAVGSDATHIKEREGEESFKMYETLPEPRLSGSFSYMVCGTVLALGTTGKPMFIEGFNSDVEIMQQNNIEALDEQRRAQYALGAVSTNGAAYGTSVAEEESDEDDVYME